MTAEQLGKTIISKDTTFNMPVSQEGEVRQSIGVGLLIVGLDPRKNGDNITDPLIWTIRELQTKPATERYAGEISIPAETKKMGEGRLSNVLGAMAEFCDDSAISHLTDHLFFSEDSYRENGMLIKGNPVDIAILVYDGSLDILFNPESNKEVSGNGWLRRSQIQKMSNVRTVLSRAIERDLSEHLISGAIENYYTNSKMEKIFSSDFLMREFYKTREALPDVTIIPRAQQV